MQNDNSKLRSTERPSSNKYAPLTLRIVAAITSATSAAAAYPAAANLFGMFPGGVMVASSAAAIYAGWHIVATSENTDHRIVSGAMASVFAVAMVAGIHTSSELKTATHTTSAATEADTLYMNQESTRMATLATVAAELRATQKSKYPAEYAALQAQVDKLSTPTPRVETATQTATATTGGIYPWVVAGLLEVVSPALLLLAGMFRRNSKLLIQETSTPVSTLSTQTATPDRYPLPLAVEEVEAAATPVISTPYELLAAMQVREDPNGFVTVAMIRAAAFGCTEWQAKQAIKEAWAAGILEKSGEGGSTRYRYSNKLRIVK
ncbi:hypothetical protein [Thiothrix winogradskyi]|uniref:Uncharacterized protein n=1 Tax=Thiothrix winogradskyi TaxID=96472 RepID=A0ABY3SVS8_9GAMM|nr:hypothetical protein [Thiothrix winogradskyi]UJS23515.1 hypothetical protein L2Y54_16420 [Thiothrix winogradskyi]